jgi:hypothetical protein
MRILVGVRLHPSLHEYPGSMPDNEEHDPIPLIVGHQQLPLQRRV